jgi:hypothetical protein
MKIVDKGEAFLEYLVRETKNLIKEPGTYVYGIIACIGLGIYWYKEGFDIALKVFLFLLTAFSITFLSGEIFGIWITKEIKKNKLASLLILAILSFVIIFIFYDYKVRYWAVAAGLMLFAIPTLVIWMVNKIRY